MLAITDLGFAHKTFKIRSLLHDTCVPANMCILIQSYDAQPIKD